MADNNNKPGIFQRLAVSAPLITGVGVGTRRLLKNTRFSEAIGGFSAPRSNFIRSFGAKVMAGAKMGANFLSSDLSIMEGKSPEMIKLAWELALQGTDPAKVLPRHPLDNVDPAISIRAFAERNQSIQGNRTLQSFVKQLGALEVHSAASGGTFTPAMFGKAKRHNFIRSNVAVASIEDDRLRTYLTNIQSKLSEIPGVESHLRMAKREGMDGAQLMLHMSGGKFGGRGVALELPMELEHQPGVIVHGVTQQTKRIVGQYVLTHDNKIVSTLKHEQMVARRFLEQVIPQIMHGNRSVSATRKLVSNFNYKMIEQSQVVANIPAGILPGHDVGIRYKSGQRTLMDLNFQGLNAEQATRVMTDKSNYRLYPATSPEPLSKGVVSVYNPQKMFLGGEGFGWDRRPGQGVGRGFGPSARALAARNKNKLRQQFSYIHTDEYRALFGDNLPMDIMARTAYVSEKRYPSFADRAFGGTLGGTGFISTQLNPQLEHDAPLSKNLSIHNEKLSPFMEGPGPYKFPDTLKFNEGEILGYEADNTPFVYKSGMKITDGFSYTDSDKPMIRLTGIHTLPEQQQLKLYRGGKFEAQKVQQAFLEGTIAEETGQKVTGQAVVLGMDELRKNRGLHNLQMITAAHDFAYKSMKRNGKTLESTTFSHTVQDMFNKSVATEVYNPDEVTKGIYQFARQHELSPFAIGRIFGAVPDVYGHDEWESKMKELGLQFTHDELAHIEKGIATGVSSYYFGGPGNAGGHGSVEPRFFELLRGNQYGDLGPRMAEDVGHRMITANPEIVQEQSKLGSALSSIIHGTKSMEGVAEYHLKNMKNKDIADVIAKGGIVHTSGVFDEIGSIYIPGSATSRAMRGYTTAEGIESRSELADAYREFMQAGIGIGLGKRNRSEGKYAADQLVGELGKAYGGTITNKGQGLARSQVIGSRYLELGMTTESEMGDLYTRGISRRHGLNMFREMEELYGPKMGLKDGKQIVVDPGNPVEYAGIVAQRERFLAGESVGAIFGADPNIGPYSVQYGKVKMMARLKDTNTMLVAQKTGILNDGSGNEIARVALGPMAGQARDYDGDNTHIMLASSTIEKDIMGRFSAGENKELRSYEDYIIRQQLLKAKAPKETGLTMDEEMVAGTRKLALTKSHVGKVSDSLRGVRAGIIQYGDQNNMSEGALSVIEGLEQVPISSKHVASRRIAGLEPQVDRIANAAYAGRGEEIVNETRDIYKDNPLAQSILSGEDQEFFLNGEARKIRGINLPGVGEVFTKAISDRTSQTIGMTDKIAQGILNGSRVLTPEEIDPLLKYSGGLQSMFKLPAKGAMSEVAETALSMKNKLMSMGGEIIEHMGKPLALGFGASLAISAVLSQPLSSLDPGAGKTPINAGRVSSANSRSIAPENVHPDPNITGEPTTSSPLTGPSVRHTNDNNAAMINIRGMNNSGANMGSISNLITQRLRGNTNVNVNIRDRKTSLSQQKIDSIYRR